VTVVFACASCFSGTGGQPWAYYLATALMIAVPLSMVSGFVYFLARPEA